MNFKIIILGFITFLMLGCQKEMEGISIELPETSVISSNSRWGVIKYPYVRVRKSPDLEDVISSAFRQGDIVKILKSSETTKSSAGGDIFWYYTVLDDVEGWIGGENLRIFDSKEQAITASKMFK